MIDCTSWHCRNLKGHAAALSGPRMLYVHSKSENLSQGPLPNRCMEQPLQSFYLDAIMVQHTPSRQRAAMQAPHNTFTMQHLVGKVDAIKPAHSCADCKAKKQDGSPHFDKALMARTIAAAASKDQLQTSRYSTRHQTHHKAAQCSQSLRRHSVKPYSVAWR